MILIPKQQKLIARLFINMWIVIFLADFMPILCTIIDTALISKFLGADQTAALGLLLPYMSTILVISLAITVGTQILCSKTLGKGDASKARATFSVGVFIGIDCFNRYHVLHSDLF